MYQKIKELEVTDDFVQILVHVLEVGEPALLLPVIPLEHGVSNGLHDGQVGHHLLSLHTRDLPTRHLQVQPAGLVPRQLDGKGDEGGHEGHLGRDAQAGGGVDPLKGLLMTR